MGSSLRRRSSRGQVCLGKSPREIGRLARLGSCYDTPLMWQASSGPFSMAHNIILECQLTALLLRRPPSAVRPPSSVRRGYRTEDGEKAIPSLTLTPTVFWHIAWPGTLFRRKALPNVGVTHDHEEQQAFMDRFSFGKQVVLYKHLAHFTVR